MTVWLGIFAICLAVFMPGVNALKNQYRDSGPDIFLADICSGAQSRPAAAVLSGMVSLPENMADYRRAQFDTTIADAADHSSHGRMPVSLASLADTPSQAPTGHHADHAAECLYCGFFTHHLPLLYSANLPAMSYGFISRIAPQHQHVAYYARPAFVPLSRAPPTLS